MLSSFSFPVVYYPMLYYFIKFFTLFKQNPLQAFEHFRTLYAQWSEDRRGKLVNEVLYMTPISLSVNQCTRQAHPLEFNRIINVPFLIERIIWHLNKAKYSIDLAMYAMNSTDISETLIIAARRGVRVRIVTQTNWTSTIERNSGIPVRQLKKEVNTLMHNKFCVIDGYHSLRELQPKSEKKPVTVCVTGSLNWINFADTCDDVFITSAPLICKTLELEFLYIWNKCTHAKHQT